MLAIACLLATIAIYWGIKRLYRVRPIMLLSPLLITPVAVIAILLWSGIPYETYNAGTRWLSDMIGPATVALAVPLYKNARILKKHALSIGISVLAGSTAAVVSSVWLARELGLSTEIVDSLAPRSATTPIALAISGMNGGLPAMTALFVLMTGLLGMMIGPAVIRLFRIRGDIARGVLFGTSAHTAGTSKAFEFGPAAGSISSIAMILTAFFTLVTAPWILGWFR